MYRPIRLREGVSGDCSTMSSISTINILVYVGSPVKMARRAQPYRRQGDGRLVSCAFRTFEPRGAALTAHRIFPSVGGGCAGSTPGCPAIRISCHPGTTCWFSSIVGARPQSPTGSTSVRGCIPARLSSRALDVRSRHAGGHARNPEGIAFDDHDPAHGRDRCLPRLRSRSPSGNAPRPLPGRPSAPRVDPGGAGSAARAGRAPGLPVGARPAESPPLGLLGGLYGYRAASASARLGNRRISWHSILDCRFAEPRQPEILAFFQQPSSNVVHSRPLLASSTVLQPL